MSFLEHLLQLDILRVLCLILASAFLVWDVSNSDEENVLISFEYFLSYVIYNVYIHPLSVFPSPKSWAATYIPYALSLRKGNLVYRIEEIHRKHGEIVRLAPNQLSFIQGETWADVYGKKPAGRANFQKDPISYRPYALFSSSHLFFFFRRIWSLGFR